MAFPLGHRSPRWALGIWLTVSLVSSNALALGSQPFIKNSFLNLQEDLIEARRSNRHLMIIFEQEGCPYCAEMHRVNFADKETVNLVAKHFDVLQMDSLGIREVMDFSGKTLTEKQLSQKLGIQFVPMVYFFSPQGKEVFRMPGYHKPHIFKAGIKYVADRQYENTSFRDYSVKYQDTVVKKGFVDEPFFSSTRDLSPLGRTQNKALALLFEQEQCASCREMHEKNFKDRTLVNSLTKNFEVVRIDIWGKKDLKDLAGKTNSEAKIAETLGVRYTPTIIFFDQNGSEIIRQESFLTPTHFADLIVYATTDARKKYGSFQEWLRIENFKRNSSGKK